MYVPFLSSSIDAISHEALPFRPQIWTVPAELGALTSLYAGTSPEAARLNGQVHALAALG